MMPIKKILLRAALVAVLGIVCVRFACADGYDDGLSAKYHQALKGKTVAFVPVSLSFDIPIVYNIGMKAQAKLLGYNYVVRDPNFNVEDAVAAANQLIAQKPDLIVVQAYDAQAMNRVAKKANADGIKWLWLNVKSMSNADGFVGANFYQLGIDQLKLAAGYCGAGTSGKIALIQSAPNIQSTIASTAGLVDALKDYPNLKLVAKQTADSDANKARSIAATVLKQYPDLCAIVGQWDGEDVGIPAAISEAGLTGKVKVITTGSGSQTGACDMLAKGAFTAYVSYDVASQAQSINDAIVALLQLNQKPGSNPFAIYTHTKILTKDNLTPSSCWNMDEMKKLVFH